MRKQCYSAGCRVCNTIHSNCKNLLNNKTYTKFNFFLSTRNRGRAVREEILKYFDAKLFLPSVTYLVTGDPSMENDNNLQEKNATPIPISCELQRF